MAAEQRVVTDSETGEEIKLSTERSTGFHDPSTTASDEAGNTGHASGNKGNEAEVERAAIQDLKLGRFGKP